MFHDLQVMVGMPPSQRVAVGAAVHALGGVLPDRLEHRQACAAGGTVAALEEAIGHERLQRRARGSSDRRRGVEGRAAGEHSERNEGRLLLRGEQAIAPIDRRAQRLMTCRRVPERRPGSSSAPSKPAASSLTSSRPVALAASSKARGTPSKLVGQGGDRRTNVGIDPEAWIETAGDCQEQRAGRRCLQLNSFTVGETAGTASGATGTRCSPLSPSTSRLVVSTLNAGDPASSSLSGPAASTTCSKLSITAAGRGRRGNAATRQTRPHHPAASPRPPPQPSTTRLPDARPGQARPVTHTAGK